MPNLLSVKYITSVQQKMDPTWTPQQKAAYAEQRAQGRTHEYSHAYATKIADGDEVFARHFAQIRSVFSPPKRNLSTLIVF